MKRSELVNLFKEWEKSGEIKIIAIDGRCTAGKTTLAEYIAEKVNCDIVHTDDFFLPSEKRTAERLSQTGGNMERERLLEEILIPLKNGEDYTYNKFSCSRMCLEKGERISPKTITIVEGSYSCHPDLYDFYDLHIFADIDADTQKFRILKRNKANANDFFSKWIPLEEKYFADFEIKEKCEIIIE